MRENHEDQQAWVKLATGQSQALQTEVLSIIDEQLHSLYDQDMPGGSSGEAKDNKVTE